MKILTIVLFISCASFSPLPGIPQIENRAGRHLNSNDQDSLFQYPFLVSFAQGNFQKFLQQLQYQAAQEPNPWKKIVYLYNLKNFSQYLNPDEYLSILKKKNSAAALSFYQRELQSIYYDNFHDAKELNKLVSQYSFQEWHCLNFKPEINELSAWLASDYVQIISKIFPAQKKEETVKGEKCIIRNPITFYPNKILGQNGLLLLENYLINTPKETLLWIQSNAEFRFFIDQRELQIPGIQFKKQAVEKGQYFLIIIPAHQNKVKISFLLRSRQKDKFGFQMMLKPEPANVKTRKIHPGSSDPDFIKNIEIQKPFADQYFTYAAASTNPLRNEFYAAWDRRLMLSDLSLWDKRYKTASRFYLPLAKKLFENGKRTDNYYKKISTVDSLELYFLYQIIIAREKSMRDDSLGKQMTRKIESYAINLATRFPYWGPVAMDRLSQDNKKIEAISLGETILEKFPEFSLLRENLIATYLDHQFISKAKNHLSNLLGNFPINSPRAFYWKVQIHAKERPWDIIDRRQLPIQDRANYYYYNYQEKELTALLEKPGSLIEFLDKNPPVFDNGFNSNLFFILKVCAQKINQSHCFSKENSDLSIKSQKLFDLYLQKLQSHFPFDESIGYWQAYLDYLAIGNSQGFTSQQKNIYRPSIDQYLHFVKEQKAITQAEKLSKKISPDEIKHLLSKKKFISKDFFQEYLEDIWLIHNDLSYSHYQQILVKINSKKGRDEIGEMPIPQSATLLYAKIHAKDGKVFNTIKTKKVASSKYISLEGIEKGSVLHIAWIEDRSRNNFLEGEYFFESVIPILDIKKPIVQRKILLLFPKQLKLQSQILNGFYLQRKNLDIQIRSLNSSEEYNSILIELKKTYFPEPEPDMPDYKSIIPVLYFTTLSPENFIFALNERLRQATYLEPFIEFFLKKEISEKIFQTAQKPPNLKRIIEKIYFYINREFDLYANYLFLLDDAGNTFLKKRGTPEDKVILMYTILRLYGISANPAYVDSSFKFPQSSLLITKNFGKAFLFIPAQKGLKENIWLDFSHRYLLPGQVTPSYLAQKALILSPHTSAGILPGEIKVSGRKNQNLKETHFVLNISKSGKIDFDITLKYQELANLARTNFDDKSNWDKILYQITGNFFPTFLLKDWKIENFDNLQIPLEIHLKGAAQSHFYPVKEGILGPMFPKKVLFILYYLSGNQRNYPLLIAHEENMKDTFVYQWPIGEVNFMPDIAPNSKNIEIKEKFGLYKLQIKKETGKVIIKRTFQLKSGWIFPENYPRYQKFCIMVKNLEDKLIQFSIKKEELKPN